ncbi:MAG: AAA family ATPase [Blastocatellia bacterium]
MRLENFVSLLKGVKQCGKGWKALCPAHEDRRPSLSISEGDNGRILLTCHAGCSTDAIVQASGLRMSDLFAEPQERQNYSNRHYKRNGDRKKIVATYNYHDESCRLLFQAVRYEPKDFRQCRPDGMGGSIWNLNDVGLVLYRLPELLAADPGEMVFCVEGEKDVENLRALGLVATCNPCGAGKWRDEYSQYLQGRNVVILPDNDEPGREHARKAAQSLKGIAASVKMLPLPDLPEKGDVSDWLNAGGDVEKLRLMAKDASEWTPQAIQEESGRTGPKIEIISASDLATRQYPPLRFAVPGILPEGLSILAGPPKLGKSWLSLNLSVAVASGGKALGKINVESGDVLYLALEDGPRRLQIRLATMVNKNIPPNLHFATRWPRVNDGGIEELAKWIESHPDARLIVIDTLKMIRPPESSQRGSVYSLDYDSIHPLADLAKERICILVVHHTRKAAAEDFMASVSGSFGLTGAADGTLVLKRERGRADASLFVTGRDVEEQEIALKFNPESGLWLALGDADEHRLSMARQEIIDLVRSAPEPVTPKVVAEQLSRHPGTVRWHLSEMAKNKDVYAVGNGTYWHKQPEVSEFTKAPNCANRQTGETKINVYSSMSVGLSSADETNTHQQQVPVGAVGDVGNISNATQNTVI